MERRWYLCHLDLLPTETHPNLLQGFQQVAWTEMPLDQFIAAMQEDYSCTVNWLMRLPVPAQQPTEEVSDAPH